MPDQNAEFRGETIAHLRSIDKTTDNIELAMRDHNASDKQEFTLIKDKIDDAAEKAGKAADAVDQIEETNTERHKQNTEHLGNLETKIDTALTEISKVNDKVTRITGIASGVGMVAGFVAGLSGWFWNGK